MVNDKSLDLSDLGLELLISVGSESICHIDKIAEFRVKYFYEFPYLYVGNMDYEKKYLDGFFKDPKALLVRILDLKTGSLVAISTAMSFSESVDILGDAHDYFLRHGKNDKDYFYYGEVIVDSNYRAKGLARHIYNMQDDWARRNGFKRIAIATVKRDSQDPRRPNGYICSDRIWESLGFKKNSILVEYDWPTLQLDGTILNQKNPLEFWEKDL